MKRFWRMAMKNGTKGDDIFPDCKQRNIAALDYWDKDHVNRIVEDCTKLSEDEYVQKWRLRAPHHSSGRTSVRLLWKEMKVGDRIYAKTGTLVVGKGTITGEYEYDPDILKDTMGPKWGQFVRVEWDKNFINFSFKFHAPMFTIREIKEQELHDLQNAEGALREKIVG